MAVQRATIYHNPRCSKSRQTLKLLQDNGIETEVIEYLSSPPSKKDLKEILRLLGFDDPRDLMRKKEAVYKEENLDDPRLTMDALINTMIAHPILIERPIVIAKGKAVIGRPPENIFDILD